MIGVGVVRMRGASPPTWLLAVAVTVLAWPLTMSAATPIRGLTDSWIFAFQRNLVSGPGFGAHMAYTYGPLGFLINPVDMEERAFVISCLFTIAVSALAAAVAISTLRARFHWGIAVATSYVLSLALARAQTPATAYLLDVFGLWLAFQILDGASPARLRRLWVTAGLLAGPSVLVAPSVGVAVVGSLIVAAAATPAGWRRAVDVGMPMAAVSLLVLWVLSGNALDQLIASLRNQAAASAGYSAAMSIEAVPGVTWVYGVAALAIVGLATWSATRGMARRARIGGALAVALVSWLLFKEGFVRHDFHDLIFFGVVPFVIVALGYERRDGDLAAARLPRRRHARAQRSILASIGAAVLCLLLAAGTPYLGASTVLTPLRSLGPTLQVLASPSRSAELRSSARVSMRNGYALPVGWLTRIGHQTVAVDPIEQGIGWAYPQLHEVAPPSVQEYVATTARLDANNVAFYRSASAPAFVIHDGSSIDGRSSSFDAPAAQVAIRCNYDAISSSASLILLQRDPGRCSSPTPLETVTTGYGHSIPVPSAPPGAAVLASFHLQTPVWWKLADAALKPTSCLLIGDGGAERYRFIVATGPDVHVLDFPDQSGDLGAGPMRSLRMQLGGLGTTGSGVTVQFFAVRVKGAAATGS